MVDDEPTLAILDVFTAALSADRRPTSRALRQFQPPCRSCRASLGTVSRFRCEWPSDRYLPGPNDKEFGWRGEVQKIRAPNARGARLQPLLRK
jgi:hypothetical protein